MFERIGQLAVRRSGTLLVAYVIALAVFGGLGVRVFSELQSEGYTNPASESAKAAKVLAEKFGLRDPFLVVAIETKNGVDTDQTAASAVATRLLAEPGLDKSRSYSYWTAGRPGSMKSQAPQGQEPKSGLVLLATSLRGDAATTLAHKIQDKYDGDLGQGMTGHVGGWGVIGKELNEQISDDLARAEAVAIPISVIALMFAFGSVVAAGLPFMVAAGAALGSMFCLWLIAQATDISVFAMNLLTGFALGLGIDYALLMVNRFREELKGGAEVAEAVVTTVRTAGRTVFVSGLTVAVTLAGLVVFPQYFMKSFAYAGSIVVFFAVLTSLVALPAAMAKLGHKVNKGKLLKGDLAPSDEGKWHDIAIFVMRRPVAVFLVTLIGLLAMAFPALGSRFAQIDDRALPASNPGAEASAFLRANFTSQSSDPIHIYIPKGGKQDAIIDISGYTQALASLPHAARVTSPGAVYINGEFKGVNGATAAYISGDDGLITINLDVPARTPEAAAVVSKIRDEFNSPRPGTLVGGGPAIYVDSQRAITGNLGFLIAWLIASTLVILFLFTGSILLPIKAVVLNALSLIATLGVLTYIFEDGHLRWLVGDFTLTGTIDTNSLVIVAVVAFGLSMDYEVFLLSRIKEEHDRGADTTTSVALGLQRSARIISTAAVLLAIVFASFVSSGVTSIKMLGFGVAFAILLDATIVRALLVPAFMRLAGRANWWAPKPLAALHKRIGLSE